MDERQFVISKNYAAIAKSRKKKPKSKRSAMLKMVMPMLSHDQGDKLADAIANKDKEAFGAAWDEIKASLEKKFVHKAAASSDCRVEGNFGEAVIALFDELMND